MVGSLRALAEESLIAFLVKQQVDTPGGCRVSPHVRRSQRAQGTDRGHHRPGTCLSPTADYCAARAWGRRSPATHSTEAPIAARRSSTSPKATTLRRDPHRRLARTELRLPPYRSSARSSASGPDAPSMVPPHRTHQADAQPACSALSLSVTASSAPPRYTAAIAALVTSRRAQPRADSRARERRWSTASGGAWVTEDQLRATTAGRRHAPGRMTAAGRAGRSTRSP